MSAIWSSLRHEGRTTPALASSVLLPVDATSSFIDEAMPELVKLDRSLNLVERGQDGVEAIADADERFRAVAEAAAKAGQPFVQELAREAETLTVSYLARPLTFRAEEADVLRHAIDVLSLLVRGSQSQSGNGKPAPDLKRAAAATWDHMQYAQRRLRSAR